MEIITQGRGVEFFTPNETTFTIHFVTTGSAYEETLREGSNCVKQFVEEFLLKNHFKKEDMKTRNFVIREETKYNQETGKYEKDGYAFNQMAFLKFDYDQKLIANMMASLSELDHAPMCQINFGLKDERECRRKILASAYQDAENQAQAIALASGKTLKCCQKVDFKPMITDYVSRTMIGSDMMYAERNGRGVAQMVENTFTPEDIELSETLYCLWIAE